MANNLLPLFENVCRFYVYVIRDPRQKKKMAPIYVGKGQRLRADSHWKYGPRNPILSKIFEKCSALNIEPVCEIVAWFDDESAAFDCERELIKIFGRRDQKAGPLCNLTDGGDGPSNPSEDTRKKIREALTGQKRSAAFREHMRIASTGRKKTKEEIEKTRLSNMGRKVSAETRAKISAAHKGKKLTDETRAKLRMVLGGRRFSPEHIAKRTASQTGLKRSEETRAKLRAINLGENNPNFGKPAHNRGKSASPEAIANMKAAQQARFSNEQNRSKSRDANNLHAGSGVSPAKDAALD